MFFYCFHLYHQCSVKCLVRTNMYFTFFNVFFPSPPSSFFFPSSSFIFSFLFFFLASFLLLSFYYNQISTNKEVLKEISRLVIHFKQKRTVTSMLYKTFLVQRKTKHISCSIGLPPALFESTTPTSEWIATVGLHPVRTLEMPTGRAREAWIRPQWLTPSKNPWPSRFRPGCSKRRLRTISSWGASKS